MALPLVWLADVLREAGVNVGETDGWTERTTNDGSDLPDAPIGVLEHHTASPATMNNPFPTLKTCMNGRSDLDGPLCHALIAYDGTVYTIAAGRANHAGDARASGPNADGDGNALYVGFEWDYAGTEKPSPEQYDAAVKATRAVLDHLGRPADAARAHKETSVTGKTDPGFVDMDQFRRDVAAASGGDDDLTPEQDERLRRIEYELLGPKDDKGHNPGWNTPVGPRTVVAMLIEVLKGFYEPQPSRVEGSDVKVPLVDAIRDTNATVYQQGTGGVSAEGINQAVSEAVRDVFGGSGEAQADAFVQALVKRLGGSTDE